MTIESFVNSPLGKLVVGILTVIARITVIKTKDGEKTPLDTVHGTIIAGFVVLGLTLIFVRVAAIVS